MPWCDECAKYFVPNALTVTGNCPKCGGIMPQNNINGKPLNQPVTAKNLDLKSLARTSGEDEKAPWHFKLLVAALVVYLSWRVVSLFI
ncbi:MAG: hypothetical protein O2841_04025 [Actinomycetota bacterium]|nr:hypothetical protein [Actinomycetota bacterium]